MEGLAGGLPQLPAVGVKVEGRLSPESKGGYIHAGFVDVMFTDFSQFCRAPTFVTVTVTAGRKGLSDGQAIGNSLEVRGCQRSSCPPWASSEVWLDF